MSTDAKSTTAQVKTIDDDEIDLVALLLSLLRGWKTLLICAILGLAIGILYSRYLNPTFKSDALIQIEDNSQRISALGANISGLVSSDASPAQTEAELIKSRMILEPVINALHLRIRLSDPKVGAIEKIKNNRTHTQINSSEGVSLTTEDGNAQISQLNVSKGYLNQPITLTRRGDGFLLTNGFDDFKGQLGQSHQFQGTDGVIQITVNNLPINEHPITVVKQSLHNATSSINSALSVVERGKQTGIIELSLTGDNQEQATSVLREIILSYIDQNQSRGAEETTKTLDFMEAQIPKLKQKLEESETAFNSFREKYGTIDVSKEAELLITENGQIDSQINELNLKKADLTTYYTDEHPLVVQINDQLKVLNDRKQEIKGTVGKLPEIQREFLQLSEDVGINRELYLTMLKNYEQLKIVKAGQIGFARIIDLPISTFNAIAPKKALIVLLATLLGLMLGVVIVFIKSMLRSPIKDPDRLEAKTGIPVIATIPRSEAVARLTKNKKSSSRLLAYVDNDGLSYEAIKSLRTHLMFGMPNQSKTGQRARVILVTGESPGIGKSYISANLTEVFGQLDKKVLIIDADMRLGRLHEMFNIEPDNGLAEYFSKQSSNTYEPKSLETIVHPTELDHVDFIPRGRLPKNPASLLASDKFDHLMRQLSEYYDYIIIDSAPVLAASDAIILARYADKVIMVTRYDKSIEGQVAYAVKQMEKANVQVDGLVLNDMQQGLLSKYSYHYNYAYGKNKS